MFWPWWLVNISCRAGRRVMGVKESQLPLEYTCGVCCAEVACQSYDFSGGANGLLRNSVTVLSVKILSYVSWVILVGWVLNDFCWPLQNDRRCHCRLCVVLPLLNATMNIESFLKLWEEIHEGFVGYWPEGVCSVLPTVDWSYMQNLASLQNQLVPLLCCFQSVLGSESLDSQPVPLTVAPTAFGPVPHSSTSAFFAVCDNKLYILQWV